MKVTELKINRPTITPSELPFDSINMDLIMALGAKCHHLKYLNIEKIRFCSEADRDIFTSLAETLIRESTELTTIWLWGLSESAEHGARILAALHSNEPLLRRITNLNLSRNAGWWQDS